MKKIILMVLTVSAMSLWPGILRAEEEAASMPSDILGVSTESPSASLVVGSGKKVSFEYTLKVDGQEIDSNAGKEPIVYTQGDNTIIPGLASQMEGLKAGDQKTVTVESKDGYGEEDPNAVQEVAKADLPKDIAPEVGMVLELQGDDGRSVPGVISKVGDDKVTINFNHPLAGKTLLFDIKVLKVE